MSRAGQIGERAAGLAHDDGQRRDVEDIDVRLDHRIERAAREQVVVQEIAIAAQAIDAPDQRAEARPAAGRCRQRLEIAGGEDGAPRAAAIALTCMRWPSRNAPPPASAQASSP